MKPGPDRYDMIIGLFVLATIGALLFWLSIFFSHRNEGENIEGWLITNSSGYSFQYPERLTTRYVTPLDWPPTLQVVPGPLECTEAGEPAERAGGTAVRTIGNDKYCRTEVSQSLDTSVVSQYAYAVAREEKVFILTFSLNYTQCELFAYEGPKMECNAERNVFDLDALVSQIMSTMREKK